MKGIADLDQYDKQYPSVVTFEPLAQTWHVKMWLCKTRFIESENNLVATSRRARAGLNPEPISLVSIKDAYFFQISHRGL